MAEPKKRTNKSKTNMRRMHHHEDVLNYIYCPECHEPVKPHHVCSECGNYKGKKVIEKKAPKIVKEEEPEKK